MNISLIDMAVELLLLLMEMTNDDCYLTPWM